MWRRALVAVSVAIAAAAALPASPALAHRSVAQPPVAPPGMRTTVEIMYFPAYEHRAMRHTAGLHCAPDPQYSHGMWRCYLYVFVPA